MYKIMDILRTEIKTMVTNMMSFAERVGEKIIDMLQYPITWISGLLLFIGEAFVGGKFICYIVLIASIIDLICGIAVSVKNKKFTQSELMRHTVEKMIVYGSALLVFLCIDRLIEAETSFTVDITAGLVGVVITLTETWSFLASLLILFPDNPFLKFMQKYLIGELARKLGCDESEVSGILNASRRKKALKRDDKGRFTKK